MHAAAAKAAEVRVRQKQIPFATFLAPPVSIGVLLFMQAVLHVFAIAGLPSCWLPSKVFCNGYALRGER